MTRARDLADSADKDISGTLTLDDLTVGGTAYVTGDLTVDTDTLYVDTTNDRVGIGTNSPSTKLHVQSDGAGNSNGSLYLEVDTATNYPAMVIQTATGGNGTETHGLYIKNTAAGYGLRIDDTSGDTSPFVVDTEGRVGIGTSSPSSPLHVVGDSSGGFLGGGIRINDTNNSSDWFIGAAGSGKFQIAEAAGSTRMVIDTSGRVTMPNQPSFYAYPSTNTVHTVNQWNTVAFNTTGWNVGGHFNTSNYRFTAPVSGKYQMTWTFQLENNNAPTWIYAYPVVNGNRNADRSRGVSFSDFMTSQYYHTENGTWILNLSANDYVTMDIYTSGATKEFKAESSWSGYLIG